jgi:hypothetical protein
MKTTTLLKSAALLGISALFIGCGSSGDSDTDAPNDQLQTPVDAFPTTGLIDLKNYIPQIDKNVTYSVSDGTVNVNGQAVYTSSDGVVTVKSDRDGLDLGDYMSFEKFISLDSGYREAHSSIEFGSNYLLHTMDQEETSIPRFYDDNDSVTMTLQFMMTADFSVSTESTTVYYTDAYESNASFCNVSYVGDYNLSGNHYTDAIALSCTANRVKGGTVDGVSTIAYDYNYTSTTILLPSIGIASVEYKSADADFTLTLQP